MSETVSPPTAPPVGGYRETVIPYTTRTELVVRRRDRGGRTTIHLLLRLQGKRFGVNWNLSPRAATTLVRAIIRLLDLKRSEL